MQNPRFASLLVKVLGGTAIALGVALGACGGVTGVTPDCTYNVDENGIKATKDGCEAFAVCDKAPNDPSKCCVDSKGNALTGDNLATCLFGYGAGPAPTTSSSSGGGTGGMGTGGMGNGGMGNGGMSPDAGP